MSSAEPRISVVIPSLGRPSLERTLASCADADEVIVVFDTARGPITFDPHWPETWPKNTTWLEGEFGVTGGHAGRVYGMKHATGTHIALMDDDDVYVDGAFALMREAACDVPVIFRMDHYTHGVLWRDRAIRFGNVSTQMYLVPNVPARLGSWTPYMAGIPEPGGDYTFIKETCEQMGDPVWREEIIAVLRPDIERPSGPSISIVTPWLNHEDLRADYMAAVEIRPGDELIIVDDGSETRLPFTKFHFEETSGFVDASNFGLSLAQNDIVLFLNNDIALRRHGWLEEIRRAVESDVLVGPMRYDRHTDVDGLTYPYIDGWCLAGTWDDLSALGGFPDGLEEPAYYSDNLLCLAARQAGMTLRDVPAVRAGLHHKESVTSQPRTNPQVQRASRLNREVYVARVREALHVATAS